MEELKILLNRANLIFHCGGDSSKLIKRLEADALARWEESFCLLSRRHVMGVVQCLNEMTDLFCSPCEPRGSRTAKFLNCKGDILSKLARGVVYQTLRD